MADVEVKLSDNIDELTKQLLELQKALSKNPANGYDEGIEKLYDSFMKLKESANEAKKALDEALVNKDAGGRDAAIAQLRQYRSQLQSVANAEKELGINFGAGQYVDNLTSTIIRYQGSIRQSTQQTARSIGTTMNTVGRQIFNVLSSSFNKAWNIATTGAKKVSQGISSVFRSLFTFIGNKLKSVFSGFNFKSAFGGGLFRLLGMLGLTKLSSSMIKLSSEMYEYGRISDKVFGDSAKDIQEWAKTTGRSFVDSEEQAIRYASTIGKIFETKGIDTKNIDNMSKSIVALTGDMANFYGLTKDDAFAKVKTGITGGARALKEYGIELSTANLNQYLLSKGIKESYNSLSDSSKTMVRYNYILQEMSSIMGTTGQVSGTWANQMDALKGKLSDIGAYLGGVFIKVLYPVIVLLNKTADAAVRLLQVLGGIFGFGKEGLGEIFGVGGGVGDVADDLDDEADAIDDVSKSAKNASKSLQSFDKLNNQVTSGASGAGGAGGLSGIDLDPNMWNIELPEGANDFVDWLNELKDALTDEDWKRAGSVTAKGINTLISVLRNSINDPKIKKNISEFNDNFTDFWDGMLDINFDNIGRTLADGLNVLTFAIGDFYEKASSKDLFGRSGKGLEQGIKGFIEQTNWNELGKSLTTGFRSALDFFTGFLDQATADDLFGDAGTSLRELIGGMLERAFSEGGSEKLGRDLANLLNGALRFVTTLLTSKNEEGDTLANEFSGYIADIITTAVENVDSEQLTEAAKALGKSFATLFSKLRDTVKKNKDKVSDDISGTINSIVDDGTLSADVSAYVGFFMEILDLLVETAEKVEWGDLAGAILNGIGTAIGDDPEAAGRLAKAFGKLLGLIALGGLLKLEITALGNRLISMLGGSINTTQNAGVLANAFKALLSNPIVGASLVITGIGATVAINKTDKDYKDAVNAIDELREEVIKKAQEEHTVYLGLKFEASKENYEGVIEQIEQLDDVYDRLLEKSKDSYLSLNTDQLESDIEQVRGVVTELQEQGVYILPIVEESLKGAEDSWNSAATRAEYLQQAIAYLDGTLETAKNGLTDYSSALSDADDTLKTSGEKVNNVLLPAFSMLAPQLATSETNIGKVKEKALELESSLDKASESVENLSTTSTFDGLLDSITEVVSKAGEFGNSIADELIKGITEELDADTTILTSVATMVDNAVTGNIANFNENGATVAQELVNGAVDILLNTGDIDNALSTTITSAEQANENIASESGKSLGKFMAEGIVEGISNQEVFTKIGEAVKNLCNKITSTFQQEMEIHSPSRIMEKLAKFIPLGAANGITDNLDYVKSAMMTMGDNIIGSWDSDLYNKIQESLSSMGNGVTAQAMNTQLGNSRLEQALGSLIARQGTQGSNIQVQLVLDGQVMQDFVINTVDGRALQTGGF